MIFTMCKCGFMPDSHNKSRMKSNIGFGTHFLAGGPGLSNDVSTNSAAAVSPGQLQKPVTIMAKDPETGTLKPVTFYPKNIVKSPGGITTIQIGKIY